jgi:hypothetical protein
MFRNVVAGLIVAGGLSAALWLVQGCAPDSAAYSARVLPETSEKVIFEDNRLGNDLRVDEVKAERTDTNRLVVKLTVFNTKDKPIECRVKYKFKGPDGFVLDETNWAPVVFDRREVTNLEQKSLTDKATDFTVLIRYEKVK